MPKRNSKITAGNREQRLRRRLNAPTDQAALHRLEQALLPAQQHAERVEPLIERRDDNINIDIERRGDSIVIDDTEHNPNPDLEDDEDDDEALGAPPWVILDEEQPDPIDPLVSASKERYIQLAREFNWNALLDQLHPVYMKQKHVTDNWAQSNYLHDFNTACACVKTHRAVDLVDLCGQKRSQIDFCSCKPDSVRLLFLGYLAGSPISPQTAFSLPVLLFYNNLWNNCDMGALPFTTALTRFVELGSQRLNVPGKTEARNIHKPFAAAVDMYRRLEEMSNALVHQVLKLSKQQVLACRTCPACFGPQLLDTSFYPSATRDRLVVCLDGNFQHRHYAKATRSHEDHRTPAIFLERSEIDHAARLIQESKQENTTPEEINRCTKSHKVEDDKRVDSNWKGCDDTGLMGCCCRHDAAIYLANIYDSGEQRCFPLALLHQLLSAVDPTQQVGVLSNVGCSMDKLMNLRQLLAEDRPRIKFGTSVFHAYDHHRTCQLDYHPRLNKGWGLSDGEGVESMWSSLYPMVSPLQFASRNYRLNSIAHRLAHYNKKGITQLSHSVRQKLNTAVQRRQEAQSGLAKLLEQRNPHGDTNRNYTLQFFERQWVAQRAFQANHSDTEEARMKQLAALYEREKVLDLMRCHLQGPQTLMGSAQEDRKLMDSVEMEAGRLREDLVRLSRDDMPAENVEERKMRLVLWNAKSQLFAEAVQLMAERQPILDSKKTRSHLDAEFKDEIIKAINDRKPKIAKLITQYNTRYSEYRLKFPNPLVPDAVEDGHLSYEKLIKMPLDDEFWTDGLFYHYNAPWAIDPKVRQGISYVHVFEKVQEECELIAQELVRAMGWAMSFHAQLVHEVAYLEQRIAIIERGESDVPVHEIDGVQLLSLNQLEKTQMIMKELCMRLSSHRQLIINWSDNFLWVWENCQPRKDEAFISSWRQLIQGIISQANLQNPVSVNDTSEDAEMEGVDDGGEDDEDDWISDDDSIWHLEDY